MTSHEAPSSHQGSLPSPRRRCVPARRAAEWACDRHSADARGVRDDRARNGLEGRHTARARARRRDSRSCASRPGVRYHGGYGYGEDPRDPADCRRDPWRPSQGRSGQPRAGSDARDTFLECRHRNDRYRAPLVPGRPHPSARYVSGRRDSSNIGRAGVVPGVGEAGWVSVYLAFGDRRSVVLCELPALEPRARDHRIRS